MRRKLVRKAEVSTTVPDHAERRLVLAAWVLAAAVLDVHHQRTLVRKAERGTRIARVTVDRVSRAARVSTARRLHIDHSLELVLCAVERPAVSFHAEVGVGLTS